MEYGVARRVSCPSRSISSEFGANISMLQDGELKALHPARKTPGQTLGRRTQRSQSASQLVHKRHMPMEPGKFHIPRKSKEEKALLKHISSESREYDGVMNILMSSYIDTASVGCFTYSCLRLVHSEQLEKEFVEKRREMKADGRTEKELEESYCFLWTEEAKVPWMCEKGLIVGQTWLSLLGDPNKGVYLSRYSDLLQVQPLTPGATGEVIIFKVMKGKVKIIYENIKNVLDPTPRFDSHLLKNASNVTSVTSFRAFELTQQYFYEYAFDELQQRPRQVCPYAVVSLLFKGKDSLLPSTPLAPVRQNSRPAEASKEGAHFTVWSGDLVHSDETVLQISLRSSSLPFLPHRLPDRLEMGFLMRLDKVTKLLPVQLFSRSLYSSSKEVVSHGHHCSLLEVVDRSRSTSSIATLLQEIEVKRLVFVTPLTERGFLFLLSSVQMASPSEREDGWKRCLQALFVFPESRDVAKAAPSRGISWDGPGSSGSKIMPGLKHFLPALHHALIKNRANPPVELSTGVELQAQEYLIGLKEGKVQPHSMAEYDEKEDKRKTPFPVPKHHQLNLDGYLQSYLHSPGNYQLSVSHARKMVEVHCSHMESEEVRPEVQDVVRSNTEKMQQLMELVLTSKRNAEIEVRREEGGRLGEMKSLLRKRRMQQKMAERTLTYLKASQERSKCDKITGEGSQASAPPGTLPAVIQSVGLTGVVLREDGSELSKGLCKLLTGLKQAAEGAARRVRNEVPEEMQEDSSPFDRLAAKLGLPANCDIDLRKQDELEDHTAGSVSSLEGFSPSGDHSLHGGGGGGLARTAGGYEDDEKQCKIPWVLTPITGLCSERYTQRERNLPKDPRFHHVTMETLPENRTPSPGHSPPLCSSPESSPPPSPKPSPPLSRRPYRPLSPSGPPSQEPYRPPSPSPSPASCLARRISSLPLPPLSWSPPTLIKQRNDEELQVAPPSPMECEGSSMATEHKAEDKEEQDVSFIEPSVSPPSERMTSPPPSAPEQQGHDTAGEIGQFEDVQLARENEQSHFDVELKDDDVMEVVDLTQSPPGFKEEMMQEAPISSPPAHPLQAIDCILDKHLLKFSSDLQLLLEKESIQCSFPQGFNAPTIPAQHALPLTVVTPFSQYVSLFHPCPPTQGYVSSLQDRINSMLQDFNGALSGQSRAGPETALASTVSAFVSSIRAANTRGDEDMPSSGEPTASDSQRTTFSGESEVWQPDAPCRQFSDPPNRSPPPHDFPAASPTSASTVVPHTHRAPEPSATLDVDFAVSHSIHQSHSTATVEPPLACEQVSSSDSLPPASALSSVIRQLKPEVLNNLCEIIKDVQRSSTLQFYIHSNQPEDQLSQDVKEYLSQQGHMEQNPVIFLKQEASDRRLLVVIKKSDIEEHIHQIPGLVSLKQQQSVVFVGINSVDDMRDHTYDQLFVCGGCVIPEDLLLNPDLVPPDQLSTLLELLKQRTSPDIVWKWVIHNKPLKKLRDQARFRRDAASLLDILVSYQKQQIVEFLPPHHCDKMNQQSPDLDCLIRHQAQNTRFRHTVFLTVSCLDFMKYSKSGIIAAGVAEMLGNFDALLGHRDNGDKQPIAEDLQSSKGVLRASSREDDDASDATRLAGLQPDSGSPPSLDQLIPEHSDKDLHILQMAISHLRAERLQECSAAGVRAQGEGAGSPAQSHASANIPTPTSVPSAAADSSDGRMEEMEHGHISTDVVSSSSTSCPAEGDTLSPLRNKDTRGVAMATAHQQHVHPDHHHHRRRRPRHRPSRPQAPLGYPPWWSSTQQHPRLHSDSPPPTTPSPGRDFWELQRRRTSADSAGAPGGYLYPPRPSTSGHWGWQQGGGGFNGM
ncbi:protein TASOR [Nerophis ophidion]|uniref:protein TASOR n=1 Tax=Nerophis ophidion TaxID=159077 RepID=UPI002ADFC37A|nr:protein TASOR [Nerophis ophidion]